MRRFDPVLTRSANRRSLGKSKSNMKFSIFNFQFSIPDWAEMVGRGCPSPPHQVAVTRCARGSRITQALALLLVVAGFSFLAGCGNESNRANSKEKTLYT